MTNRTKASRQFLRKFSQSPLRLSSIKLPLPSENLLCHLNTNERLTLECVTDCLMNLCVSVGVFTVHEILAQELHMNRICARWVPRLLSEENMTNRTKASRQFLRKFSQSGIGFLDRLITTDETWFHYYDPVIIILHTLQ
jgi:hypothetical protein